MNTTSMWRISKQTYEDWSSDNVTRLSASLAYYTALSLAPLLVLAVSIAGLVFGEEAARGHIATELSNVVGEQAGKAIEMLLRNARSPEDGALGSLVGGTVLLFGASGVFGELQTTMNEIWKVTPKPGRGLRDFVRQRFFSFACVLGVAFLLLVSLVMSAIIAALGRYFTETLPGGAWLWQGLNFLLSLGIITVLFALIFKVVPDVEIAWRDVWMGATVTSLLFSLGKFALGLYLGRASVASPYGAAGSLVALVIWVYYASQILFMGAEFTQVYARLRGSRVAPSDHAVPVEITKTVIDDAGEKHTASVSGPRTA
jgi:membrane protein